VTDDFLSLGEKGDGETEARRWLRHLDMHDLDPFYVTFSFSHGALRKRAVSDVVFRILRLVMSRWARCIVLQVTCESLSGCNVAFDSTEPSLG